MNRTRMAVLGAFGIALIFALGYLGGKSTRTGAVPAKGLLGQEQNREFPVHIYSDSAYPGQCFLDWPVATLWKAKQQTVKWFSDDNDYTIDFGQGTHAAPKNPFQGGDPPGTNIFIVPAGGDRASGSLQSSASGYYDFAVFPGKGNSGSPCKKATDPDPGYYVK